MATEYVFDLTNYRDSRSEHIDPGQYSAVVEDIEKVRTNADDADMFNVYLSVVGGEFDGATLIDRLVQKKPAMFRTVGFLRGCGVQTPKKRFKLDMAKLIGKRVTVDVEDREYRGEINSEVRGYVIPSKKANGATSSKAQESDLDADELSEDGSEEFAAETTQNPSAEAEQVQESRKREEPAEVDAPEEVDLDEVEL